MFSQRAHRRQQREGYEQAVREHAADLFGFAFRLTGNRDVAEELVQETYFHAWRGLDSLREPERLRAWLFQILRHRHSRLCRVRILLGALQQAQGEIVRQHGPQPDHANSPG